MKIGKRAKKKDDRPARKRYWAKRTLETRKVNNLVKYCGMSKQAAYSHWHKVRQGRVPPGYLHKENY